MLRGINPILTGDLLKVLSDMGHGDEIVIADGNYAATADSTNRPPVWVPSADVIKVVKAILEVFPIDSGSDRRASRPVHYMTEYGDALHTRPTHPIHDEFIRTVAGSLDLPVKEMVMNVGRYKFHEEARKAYAIVATFDPRHYACFILRKGVLPDPTAWIDEQ